MPVQSFIIDAFTGAGLKGNQAAVCLLKEAMPRDWLQEVAAEFNLSETAFLLPLNANSADADTSRWHLRWFTPTCEIKLCGHATLASAHVLKNEMGVTANELIFSTLSGDLIAQAHGDKISLDFPRTSVTPISNLTAEVKAVMGNALAAYAAGENILLEFAQLKDVQNYQPNFAKLAALRTPGVIITAPAGNTQIAQGVDFVSRFFAPNSGIDEDPVTGSAHCALATLWQEKFNKTQFRAAQLSPRGGILDVVWHPSRVELIGSCATFLRGNLAQEHPKK